MPRKLEDIKINRNKKTITFSEKIILRELPSKKDDIIISENRFIHNKDEQKILENESKIEKYITEKKERINTNKRLSSTPAFKKEKSFLNRKLLYTFLVILTASVLYFAGDYFQKANIVIESKTQQINYDKKQFMASHDDLGVEFEIMIVPDIKTKSLTLVEPKEVSEYAKGTITLFNEFSTNPQNLSTGTMMSDQDGKVYKINQAVTIPGFKSLNGKVSPGKVDVPVIAFLPGDVYNNSSTTFHINAFKGTTKNDKIYGKILDPIVGGASGLVYTLNSNDLEGLEKFINSSKNTLYDKVRALVPEGYILYDGSINFSYSIPNNFYSKEQEAKIEIPTVLTVIILKKDSLINNIKKDIFSKLSSNEIKEIEISQLENLTFNFENQNQEIKKDIGVVPFNLSGNILALWHPDLTLLRSNLKGVLKSESINIFRQDPGVVSATVKIFPFWKKYIPNDINKININLK